MFGDEARATLSTVPDGGLRISSRLLLVVLLTSFVVAWFAGLGYRKLANPDEGRYAEIAREMVASGNWTTPHLNTIKYFEKPPLQYWTTAIAYQTFGMSEWTARLWPAVTGFLGVVLTWFAGRRLFGASAGLLAAAVLSSTIYYVLFGHLATLDMGLTFFLTAAVFAFVLAQTSAAGSRQETGWMMAAWGAAAGAVLSKGLIGVVLPGLALAAYSLWHRDTAVWRRLHPIKGGLLFLAISAPWFVMVQTSNPEFAHFFFLHEHFDRFTSTAHRRSGAFWYFVPVLLVGLLPWTYLALEAVRDAWRTRPSPGEFGVQRFLLVWIAIVFVFFSVSGSKLPAYVLPVVPAFALLIGRRLDTLAAEQICRRVAPMLLVTGVGLFAANEVIELMHESQTLFPLYENFASWMETAAVVFLVSASLFALAARFARTGVLLLALVGLVAIQLAVTGYESLSPLKSAYAIAQEVRPYLRPGTRVFNVGRYDQSLPPYLQQPVILVANADELSFGLNQEPDRWLSSLEDFENEWRAAPSAVAVMTPESYQSVLSHGLPLQVLSQDDDHVVVVKPN
ncbi:MAG: phospholipid carrier-dependent glycosyltransferase [Burkholderiales bacterium]